MKRPSNDDKLVWAVVPLAVATALVAELWPRRDALWTVLFIALAWETRFLAARPSRCTGACR